MSSDEGTDQYCDNCDEELVCPECSKPSSVRDAFELLECPHLDEQDVVTTNRSQKGGYDPHKPHMAIDCCRRRGCLLIALGTIEMFTGEHAVWAIRGSSGWDALSWNESLTAPRTLDGGPAPHPELISSEMLRKTL